MNTKIITPGQKIKEIRKIYNIKQHEICGNMITRNMISMIETDKAGLTENTAKIIIENIIKVCEEKNIKIDICLEDLTQSAESQAKKIANDFIIFFDVDYKVILKKEYENYIKDVEYIIEKYRLREEKFSIYERLGWANMKSSNYYKSYTYFLKAFENCNELFNNIKLINIIINISFCCRHLKLYKEGMDFIRLAYIYMNNIPNDQLYTLKYNNIIFLKKLEEYDACLDEIQTLGPIFKNLSNYGLKKIYILIIKANCLKEKKLFNNALDVHKDILTMCTDDIEIKLVTFCNMLEIYMCLDDTRNTSKYLDTCTFALKDYENLDKKIFSPDVYYTIALGYNMLNEFHMSKIYFHKALIESTKYKDKNIITSCLRKLLDIYIYENSHDDVLNITNILKEIISLELLPANDFIIFDFISYYNNINDSTTVNNIISFLKNYYRKDSY